MADWGTDLRLDADDVVPLYHQLKERIRAQARRLEPGTLIPSEKELMQLGGVGRATVRKAISDLVQEGVLTTHQGRGTFTAPERIQTSLSRPAGFTETMERLGRRPQTRVLHAERRPALPEVAERLRIAPGDGVYVIERLRLIDGEPCMLERTHMAERLLPGLLGTDLSGSLYAAIAERYGLRPATGIESIVAVNADRHLAHLLGVPIASALLATVRVTETDDGRPLEYTLRHARGDLLAFTVALAAGSSLADRSSAAPLLAGVDP
jgi:GntR family transcriptional regulator